MDRVRIFISSPGDVADERQRALAVVEQLQEDFSDSLQLEPLLWEQEPLLATADFQSQIRSPADFDIFATIIGARLGSPLGAQFTRRDGSPYASGTEFEFEVAVASHFADGSPELLVYRKSLADDVAASEQIDKVVAFFDKWYRPGGEFAHIGAYHSFDTTHEFEYQFESHLRQMLLRFLPRPNNLPTPISSFVGRFEQVCEVGALLTGDPTTSVNLVGPRGVGKSRLALRIARGVMADFPHGAFLIDLTDCSGPEEQASSILRELPYELPTGGTAIQQLQAALQGRHLLLVLDNVTDGEGVATLLAAFQADCSELRVLATSRTAISAAMLLGVVVAPFNLPDSENADLETIFNCDGVQLFVDRAQVVRESFRLTEQNGQEVLAICQRLQGLPRSIELAASRMRTLNVSKILRTLDSLKVKDESGQTVYLIPR